MKNNLGFINGFISRSGGYVLTSTVLSRGLSFLASWIAIKLIPNKDLGSVIYAYQLIVFLIPIGGLGLEQSLVRYGARFSSISKKNELFLFTLKYGVLLSLGLIIVIIITSNIISFKLDNTRFYFILLAFGLSSHFVFGVLKTQLRLQKRNKLFSIVDLSYSLIFVLLVTFLSYFFSELGYALAIVLSPLITSLVFISKLKIKWEKPKSINNYNLSFWKYGFFASLSNVTTQLLVAIDIILIGYFLNELELVTAYKYVSLIPYSLLFLSQAFITTDFVTFTEKIKNKSFIKRYIRNYIKLFSLISLTLVGIILFYGTEILIIFDTNYSQYHNVFIILTLGITGILILRGIYGNLLSSIGKAHINFQITSVALIANIALNYYLIPRYGILGAAVTSSVLMWFTGILSWLSFKYLYNKNTI